VSKPKRFIIVSNRLPITFERNGEALHVQPSCGGLVSALAPVLHDSDGVWIGWTGTDHEDEVGDLLRDYRADGYSVEPVFLTAVEKACFYHGCSNEIIWPLFHDLQSKCKFDPTYWEVYREVTEKYADAVEKTARKDDFVWVHDYHLMMLADSLRAREMRFKLAYFHHIPFPPPDIFEKLPWRKEILRGLLQFNSIGFQTARDRRNFIACLRRHLSEVHVSRLNDRFLVRSEGMCTVVGNHAISIDFQTFATEALDAQVAARSSELQRDIKTEQIILGVDRLDYTKGIPEKLMAFRNLLERYPELHSRITLVQVVVPSREEIPKYKELKLHIEGLVSEINGEYGVPGWVPVQYLHRCLSRTELAAFYSAADIALVTPLRDGMNLVAKEYCACRVEDSGVLVLSEFAGAAQELKLGALLVNPYDTEGVASALYRAFRMSGREQRIRVHRMRRWIERHDVFHWCKSFCAQATPAHFYPQTKAAVVSFPRFSGEDATSLALLAR
jgi:alpha,alpha-trehalose-phosphate synthase [UDP-forming]